MWKASTNSDNLTLLFIWRVGGPIEVNQDNDVLNTWNCVRFNPLPYPSEKDFIVTDVRKGLHYPDNTFDGIYAFHISEHLTWHENITFTNELRRILKPEGICRLSSPDLYSKAIEYLNRLDEYRKVPNDSNRKRYNWSILILIDQLARLQSGGEMIKTLRRGDFDIEQVKELHGDVFNHFMTGNTNWKSPYKRKSIRYILYAIWRKVFLTFPVDRHTYLIENERFYFDDISYTELMRRCHFQNIKVVSYKESRILGWEKYQLDRSNHGEYPLEPSCFIEGQKSSTTP